MRKSSITNEFFQTKLQFPPVLRPECLRPGFTRPFSLPQKLLIVFLPIRFCCLVLKSDGRVIQKTRR